MATGDTALRLTAANSEYLGRTTDLLDYNSDYSQSFWVRFAAIDIEGQALTTIRAATNAIDSLTLNNVLFKLEIWARNPSSTLSEKGSTVLAADTWYHVCFRRSGDDLAVFLNGVAETFSNYTLAVSGRSSATLNHYGANADADAFGDISIKGLVIHQRALTAAQVVAQMEQSAPVDPTDLYGYYPFDESTAGVDVADRSGNGRDWTAYNTPTATDGPGIPLGTPSLQVASPTTAAPPSNTDLILPTLPIKLY